MKKTFRLLNVAALASFLGVFFTACEPETDTQTGIVTFEDVNLGTSGYWNGSDMSGVFSTALSYGDTIQLYQGGFRSDLLTCANIFNVNPKYQSAWWSGFACSNHTNMDSIGMANQYSVYATSGASGSKNFALIGSNGATCDFAVPVYVKSLMVNNSTYDYWALKEGKDGAGYVTKFKAGDYFTLTITGYNTLGVQMGQVVVPLAEFRNGQSYICSTWTKISLAALGEVSKMAFTFDSSDKYLEWLNTPTYACLDNIVYEIK
jgi:hypothetical protein